MSTGEPLTPRDRDAALQKLRDWRTTIAIGSAGAVVAFGVVAAVTIPGKASAAGATDSGDTQQSQQQPSDTSQGDTSQAPADPNSGASTLQAPQQMPAFGFGGGGRAVSGGSH